MPSKYSMPAVGDVGVGAGVKVNACAKVTQLSLCAMVSAVVHVLPSALIFTAKSSVPDRPISARPDQFDWKRRLAVSAVEALFTFT